ncbi:MAG: hypothetical protein NPIRA04_28490 [Nitrospirales bacterium]|nr:MAG: hypothetical protein NPIRA04_28490 [Nitrospirales bacterium]
MLATHPSRHFITRWILIGLVFLPSFAYSEVIQGFRDLKFGMTEHEVQALEHCTTSSECLYELAGKNRYLHPVYSLQTTNTHTPQKLTKISIDMGRFTNELYEELQVRLQDQYQVTYDLQNSEIEAFQNEQSSKLTSAFENGQVLLQVSRRKYGVVLLSVIYQNADLAGKFLKTHHTSPKP